MREQRFQATPPTRALSTWPGTPGGTCTTSSPAALDRAVWRSRRRSDRLGPQPRRARRDRSRRDSPPRPVEIRRRAADDRANLVDRHIAEPGPQRLSRVGRCAFAVREVGTPHHVVEVDVVAMRHIVGLQEARTQPAVALEVVTRSHRPVDHGRVVELHRLLLRIGEGIELGIQGHAERAEPLASALLGGHELQLRMAFENTTEDQVPDGAMTPERVFVDEDRHRRRVVGQGRSAAARMRHNRHAHLDQRGPQRVVGG